MRWQVQEAKQRFSELLRAVESEGVQYVTKHGKEIAVVLSIDEFHRLAGHKYASFNSALLAMPPVDDPDVFERRRDGAVRATEQPGWV
jgi:prevent-host-death family protein